MLDADTIKQVAEKAIISAFKAHGVIPVSEEDFDAIAKGVVLAIGAEGEVAHRIAEIAKGAARAQSAALVVEMRWGKPGEEGR